MHITSFGSSFIKLNIKSPQIGDSVLLLDPFATKTWGMRQPKLDADVIAVSEEYLIKSLPLPKEALVITEPGEYEHKEIYVMGLPSQQPDNKRLLTYYMIEAEGMTIIHLGATKQTEYSDEEYEFLTDADILFIPVGGGSGLSGKQAAALVKDLEPRVIIPVNFKYSGAKTNLSDEKEFLKELGNPKVEKTNKLSIKKKDLPQDDSQVIIIHP